jgi:antitoxin component of MazEF toxin-antitoxin module
MTINKSYEFEKKVIKQNASRIVLIPKYLLVRLNLVLKDEVSIKIFKVSNPEKYKTFRGNVILLCTNGIGTKGVTVPIEIVKELGLEKGDLVRLKISKSLKKSSNDSI